MKYDKIYKSMLPKIIFKYSHIYDQNWQTWFKVYKKSSQKFSPRKVQSYMKAAEKVWRKYEKIILQELPRIIKLKWKEKKIICYVVGDCRPFSDPLTLPVYEDKGLFIDVLIHELIHQLFSQGGNYKKAKKAWGHIYRKYKNESRLTRIHIPLHAIHWHVYKKIFNEKRLNRNINRSIPYPDYKRAWEIVEKGGYENVIKEFSSRIIK